MHRPVSYTVLLVAMTSSLVAQTTPARQTPQPQPPTGVAASGATLPIRRVVLYKTGVGYFEHLGNVRNQQDVAIRFTSAQLNDGIVEDQQRLRENMKALRGSAEEKQLLLRYTRQLDEQENKLEALRREIAATTSRRDAARQELNVLIERFSYEG